MKTLLTALTLAITSASAFAGTAISYTNPPLGFRLSFSAMADEGSICDTSDHCLTIVPVKNLSRTKTLYREVNGRCDLEIESFDKDFGEGNTKNDFMLHLGVQVVRVVKGEDGCQLQQDLLDKKRSVTGLYF